MQLVWSVSGIRTIRGRVNRCPGAELFVAELFVLSSSSINNLYASSKYKSSLEEVFGRFACVTLTT